MEIQRYGYRKKKVWRKVCEKKKVWRKVCGKKFVERKKFGKKVCGKVLDFHPKEDGNKFNHTPFLF